MPDQVPGDAADEQRQDPIVKRLRPDPTFPPPRPTTLRGFLGNSDREGYRRIYFTRSLNYYAEVQSADILQIVAVPPELSPFPGEESSMIDVAPGVRIDYVRSSTTRDSSAFDLDVRPVSLRFDPGTGPVFIDTSESCDIFDTTCGGAGCGYPNPTPSTVEAGCLPDPRRRGRAPRPNF